MGAKARRTMRLVLHFMMMLSQILFCKIYELEELCSYDGKYRQTFFQSLVLFSFNRQFDAFQLCLILVEEV